MQTLGRNRVLLVLAGASILVAGFVTGRAIGSGEDSSPSTESTPASISTRQGAVEIPALDEAEQIPTLEVTPQTVEEEPEVDEESEPSSSPVEETPTPSPESAPEVTVAPNG